MLTELRSRIEVGKPVNRDYLERRLAQLDAWVPLCIDVSRSDLVAERKLIKYLL